MLGVRSPAKADGTVSEPGRPAPKRTEEFDRILLRPESARLSVSAGAAQEGR